MKNFLKKFTFQNEAMWMLIFGLLPLLIAIAALLVLFVFGQV